MSSSITLHQCAGICAAAALIGSSVSARADVVFGNLPLSSVSAITGIDTAAIKVFSFAMAAGTDYSLDSVVLRLGSYDSGDLPVLQLRDNTGSTVLANFTAPASQGSAGAADYTFMPTTSFTMAASTTYRLWLGSGAGSFNWPGVVGGSYVGVATLEGSFRSVDGGLTFFSSNVSNGLQINGTPTSPVPEPGAWVLMTAGLGVLALGARRKKALLKAA